MTRTRATSARLPRGRVEQLGELLRVTDTAEAGYAGPLPASAVTTQCLEVRGERSNGPLPEHPAGAAGPEHVRGSALRPHEDDRPPRAEVVEDLPRDRRLVPGREVDEKQERVGAARLGHRLPVRHVADGV